MLDIKSILSITLIALALEQSSGVIRYPLFNRHISYFAQYPEPTQARSEIDDGRPVYRDLAPIRPRSDLIQIDSKHAKDAIIQALKEFDKRDRFTKPSEDIHSLAVHKDYVGSIYLTKQGQKDIYHPKMEFYKKPKYEVVPIVNQNNGFEEASIALNRFLFKKSKKASQLDDNLPNLLNTRFVEDSASNNGYQVQTVPSDWRPVYPSGRAQNFLSLLQQ